MSRAMRAIRNPRAIVAILRKAKRALPAPKWAGTLAAPVFPAETDAIARATSLLAGMDFIDGTRHPDTLTLSQAQDVLRWATARIR